MRKEIRDGDEVIAEIAEHLERGRLLTVKYRETVAGVRRRLARANPTTMTRGGARRLRQDAVALADVSVRLLDLLAGICDRVAVSTEEGWILFENLRGALEKPPSSQ